MFRTSPSDRQVSLFGFRNQLSETKRKRLDQSEESAFYRLVVSRIDEEMFSPLYCEDNGRPNSSIRALVGAMILMYKKGWTVEELFQNIEFNLLTMRALGVDRVDEKPFCRATFYNFQDRLTRHYVETGENLLERVFDQLTVEQLQELDIKTTIQRTDSFQAMSNVASYSRLRLLIEVIIRLHRVLEEEDVERFQQLLEPYVKQSSGHYVYRLSQSDLPEEIEKLGRVYHRLYTALKEKYQDYHLFRIFERVYHEHFTATDGRVEVRPGEELSSGCLQSPDDEDATYRRKNGEEYRGQVINAMETAHPDNEMEIVTDVAVRPNNTDDDQILAERLGPLKEKTPRLKELHTDGGYGSERTDAATDRMDIRHVVTCSRGRDPTVDWEIEETEQGGYEVSCPRQTVQAEPTPARWKACFDPQTCAGCPRAEDCPTRRLEQGRTLYFDRGTYLATRRRRNLRKIPPERRKLRSNVEATVKEFTAPLNHKGKLRRRGRFKTAIYAFCMGIAINFGREFRHRQESPPTDTSFSWPAIPSEAARYIFRCLAASMVSRSLRSRPRGELLALLIFAGYMVRSDNL